MTQVISFWGSSDDLIELEINGKFEEEYCVFKPDSGLITTFKVYNLDEGLKVYAIYDGCWSFGVGLLSEDDKLPDWPIVFGTHKNGYSMSLNIKVPKDVVVEKYD